MGERKKALADYETALRLDPATTMRPAAAAL